MRGSVVPARFRLLALTVALATPFAAFGQDPKPQPPAVQKDLRARIDAALEKASKALSSGIALPGELQPPPPPPDPRFPHRGHIARPAGLPRSASLVAFALVRAGGADGKARARKILDAWWEQTFPSLSPGNYETSIAISAMAGLGMDRIKEGTTISRYELKELEDVWKKRIRIATRSLVDGRSRPPSSVKGCAWTYNLPKFKDLDEGKTGEKENDSKTGERLVANQGYDHSNTQWSVLALEDAAHAGVAIPVSLAEEIAEHFIATVCRELDYVAPGETPKTYTGDPPIFWGYGAGSTSDSMTCAGLSSLGVARELGSKSDELEKTIKGGIAGVAKYYRMKLEATLRERQVPQDPRDRLLMGLRNGLDGYYLYSLEKALDICSVTEIDGKDWFAPLAEKVLAAQKDDGTWADTMWGASDPLIGTALHALFLARATVTKARIVDGNVHTSHRSETGGSSDGEVFLARTKTYKDAIALVRRAGQAAGKDVAPAIAEAREALEALCAEGHGRDACLLGPVGELFAGDAARREAASSWLSLLAGREVKADEALAAGATYAKLAQAREDKNDAALRAGLASPLHALRAFAASTLAALPCPDSAGEVIAAAETLAGEAALETPAGSRCARALGDALTGLVRGTLPQLPRAGKVGKDELRALATEARRVGRKAVEDSVERGLASYSTRERDPEAWKKTKDELARSGGALLARLVEIAGEDPERAPRTFKLLRALTGELIPDDVSAWGVFLASKK